MLRINAYRNTHSTLTFIVVVVVVLALVVLAELVVVVVDEPESYKSLIQPARCARVVPLISRNRWRERVQCANHANILHARLTARRRRGRQGAS